MSKKTSKGRTITTSGPFLGPRVELKINPPKKSGEFDEALYYDGVHYFSNTIKERPADSVRDEPYEIQGIFYCGRKWRQDTFYISETVRDILIEEMN